MNLSWPRRHSQAILEDTPVAALGGWQRNTGVPFRIIAAGAIWQRDDAFRNTVLTSGLMPARCCLKKESAGILCHRHVAVGLIGVTDSYAPFWLHLFR